MMPRFPDWLPEGVAARARELHDKGGLEKDSTARLIRLCCDQGMKTVWRNLRRAAPDDGAALLEFFEFVRLEAAFPGKHKAVLPRQQRRAFKRIAELSRSLTKELQRLGPDPVEELRAALRRTPKALAQKQLAIDTGKLCTVTAFALHDLLQGGPDSDGLMESLDTLTRSAALAAEMPAPGPRMRGAKNVARTEYIQMVDRFVLERFGRRMHTVVATTVNVIFALDDPVSADLVRNLSPSISPTNRKISAKSRK